MIRIEALGAQPYLAYSAHVVTVRRLAGQGALFTPFHPVSPAWCLADLDDGMPRGNYRRAAPANRRRGGCRDDRDDWDPLPLGRPTKELQQQLSLEVPLGQCSAKGLELKKDYLQNIYNTHAPESHSHI